MKEKRRKKQDEYTLEELKNLDLTTTFPTLLTENEVSKLIRRQPRTLMNWRQMRKGPDYIKVESGVLYKAQDILDWIDRNIIKSVDVR